MSGQALTTSLILVGYLIVVVFAVRHFARARDNSMDEYAVAGRSFPWYLALFTILGTMFTGYQYTGGPGWAAGSGFIAAYGIASMIGGFGFIYFVAPKVWLWGKAHGLYNSPELV